MPFGRPRSGAAGDRYRPQADVSNNVALADSSKGDLCVGFRSTLRSDEVRETMRNILAKWES